MTMSICSAAKAQTGWHTDWRTDGQANERTSEPAAAVAALKHCGKILAVGILYEISTFSEVSANRRTEVGSRS